MDNGGSCRELGRGQTLPGLLGYDKEVEFNSKKIWKTPTGCRRENDLAWLAL